MPHLAHTRGSYRIRSIRRRLRADFSATNATTRAAMIRNHDGENGPVVIIATHSSDVRIVDHPARDGHYKSIAISEWI